MRVSFNIIRDGKYYAKLVSVDRAHSQYNEQLRFGFKLYNDTECEEDVGTIMTYYSYTPKLYDFFKSLEWPKVTEEGVELKTALNDRIDIPRVVAETTYMVQVSTTESKSGKVKQILEILV